MNRTTFRMALLAGWPLLAALVAGCGSRPTVNRMTPDDYQFIANDIAGRLGTDLSVGLLAKRSPDSPVMVIAPRKVINYTSDIMSDGAKWLLVRKVVGALQQQPELLKSRNIVFVVPEEQARAAIRDGKMDEVVIQGRHPTHVLDVTFRSSTRSTEKDRTDDYMCEYRILALTSGEEAWSSHVEFKRWAEGRRWD